MLSMWGVSLGIADIPTTIDRVAASLDAGYKRVKLKIKRGHDLTMIQAVRERFPEAKLTVDANTDYRLSDLPLLKAMDAFALDYIEQPLAFDDITDHVHVQEKLLTAICPDESIRSSVDARKALVARACRVINIKVGRVGGHSASRAIHDVCAAFDVPVWCGGMLEAGIGRAHNIHLSTLPNFTKPGIHRPPAATSRAILSTSRWKPKMAEWPFPRTVRYRCDLGPCISRYGHQPSRGFRRMSEILVRELASR